MIYKKSVKVFMSRGFTSETSIEALEIKQEKDQKRQIAKLEREVIALRNKKDSLLEKYHKVKDELSDFKKAHSTLAFLSEAYPHLYQHIISLNLKNDSNDNSKYGNRFSEDVMPIYVLLSMAGEYFTNLLHDFFGFPCAKTIRNYRNKFKEEYGISKDLFDGSCESIIKLLNLFWNGEDNRCVISIDAAAVNAKLTIHKDGLVEGLMDEITIEKELVQTITKNPDKFHEFYEEHKDEIVKYYFVIYLCSLDENNKSFPLVLKRKTNGSANDDITADLEELVIRCNAVGLNVVGISFDGDTSYLKYVNLMIEEIDIIEELDLKKPLSSLLEKYKGILIFEDMFHLVKCNRFRLSCGSEVCASLSNDEETFGPSDLIEIGIKEYILDSSKTKKMDDNLPLLLFSRENIEKAINAKKYNILLALLPSYLLLNSVLSTELTRAQRIEQLTYGFALVFTYYHDFLSYDFQNGLQSSSRNGGHNQHMTLFDIKWMKKYLSLVISLVKILVDPKAVHLGSLGTHFLEHFFGMIRRFCSGNDTSTQFEKSVENIVIFKTFQKRNIEKLYVQVGRSDSGARLKKEEDAIREIPVDICLWRASELMNKVGCLLNTQLRNIVYDSVNDYNILSEDPIMYVLHSFANKKRSFYSTSNLRYNSTSGIKSLSRMISTNQI